MGRLPVWWRCWWRSWSTSAPGTRRRGGTWRVRCPSCGWPGTCRDRWGRSPSPRRRRTWWGWCCADGVRGVMYGEHVTAYQRRPRRRRRRWVAPLWVSTLGLGLVLLVADRAAAVIVTDQLES